MIKKQRVTVAIILATLVLFSLTGCIWERDNSGNKFGGAGTGAEKGWKTESTSSNSEQERQEIGTLNWQKYELGDYSFDYPPNWQVEVGKKINADDADLYITLKNTDKAIVLGGAAPDDFYVEKNGKNAVNTDKYADKFIIITVDIYRDWSALDWQTLVSNIYPGVIGDTEGYEVTGRPDLTAVKARTLNGVLSGEPRFFIKSNKAAYDVALQYKNWEMAEAEEFLNKFIVQFPF